MYLNTDYATPAELTGFVRAGLADRQQNQFTLSRWLPNQFVDDLDYRFTRGGEGLIDAASYRTYDAEAPIGARPGVTRVSGELPPISRKVRLGEYDRLKRRSDSQGATRAGLMSDADRMMRSVAARIELARGDALLNGSVTINENGVIATVSFGRTGGHSVSAGTPWSTVGSATPLSDLTTWIDTYLTTNGVYPQYALTSTRVINLLLQNAEIRTILGTTLGVPSAVSRDQLNGVLASRGLPQLVAYDARVKVAGVSTRVIADDKLILLPGDADGDDLGATLYGTTAEALSSDYDIDATDAPGIVAGAYETKDPVALWTKASAIALPVLVNPDLTFVADVAA